MGLFFAILLSSPSYGGHMKAKVDVGADACERAFHAMSKSVFFTKFGCMAKSAPDNEGLWLMFVADEPVFAVEEAKRRFLMSMVVSTGSLLEEKRYGVISGIVLMDRDLGLKGKYFFIPAGASQLLVREAQSGKLDIQGLYRKILEVGRILDIDKLKR
jgi:hypothetical protein